MVLVYGICAILDEQITIIYLVLCLVVLFIIHLHIEFIKSSIYTFIYKLLK